MIWKLAFFGFFWKQVRCAALDLNDTYKVIEGDILVPQLPEGMQGGAVYAGVQKWPANDHNEYVIPYDKVSIPTPKLFELIHWAMEYLMRGSNIVFRPKVPSDRHFITFSLEGNACQSQIPQGQSVVVVYLSPRSSYCHRRGSITHELLHALGFMHEHQRRGREKYLNERNFLRGDPKDYSVQEDAEVYTPYDPFSIMSYPSGPLSDNVVVEYFDPKLNREAKGNKMFLTRCDWRALNLAYPGNKLPPSCTGKEEIPDVLVPINEESVPPSEHWACRHNPDAYFAWGRCKFRNGKKFPDLDFIATKGDEKVKTRQGLRQFCATIEENADPEKLSPGANCTSICHECGRQLRQYLTKNKVRFCVREAEEMCVPLFKPPRSHSGRLSWTGRTIILSILFFWNYSW